MSTVRSRWDLSEIDVSKSSAEAALAVVGRLTIQKEDIGSQWQTAIRLAQANGASLREIAAMADVSPQTISNVCSNG